jgi:plasmid stabilization system protein ParE
MPEPVWTARASADLQEAYEWLEDQTEESGDKLLEELDHALGLLLSFPEMGTWFQKPARRFIITRNYGVIYVHEPRGLVLLRFVDLRRDMTAVRAEIRKWYESQ